MRVGAKGHFPIIKENQSYLEEANSRDEKLVRGK
jgi:hypothetical protein